MPGISGSGLFFPTWRDILDATQLAIDFDAEDHKVAMFQNTIDPSPSFSTDTAYGVAPYDGDEVSGTGYSPGGKAITGTTVTESPTGTLMWDATDVAWASSTITDARGALIYAAEVAGDPAICLIDFTTDYSSSSGTFTISWASTGILTIDLTP